MNRRTARLIVIVFLTSICSGCSDTGNPPNQVSIGQAAPTLSFLPLWSARALDSFQEQGVDLRFIAIRGGDPTALAALDSGDIDFAAVGSTTALKAIARGQPFEIIYSLMSVVSLELVVSNAFLTRYGISPSDPLPRRIAALNGAVIGATAIGGTQERVARWLVEQGGLDPRQDINVAQIGPPPALHAALEDGQIDGFILSPPEGMLAEASGSGRVLIRLNAEFADLRALPFNVLVARKPLDGRQRELAIATVRALQSASDATLADPEHVGAEIQRRFFPSIRPEIIVAAIDRLGDGISAQGRITRDDIARLLSFTAVAGDSEAASLAPSDPFWTNTFVETALTVQ